MVSVNPGGCGRRRSWTRVRTWPGGVRVEGRRRWLSSLGTDLGREAGVQAVAFGGRASRLGMGKRDRVVVRTGQSDRAGPHGVAGTSGCCVVVNEGGPTLASEPRSAARRGRCGACAHVAYSLSRRNWTAVWRRTNLQTSNSRWRARNECLVSRFLSIVSRQGG